MAIGKKPSRRRRGQAVDRWSNTPAANPDYRGATPNDVGRALLGKRPLANPNLKSRV